MASILKGTDMVGTGGENGLSTHDDITLAAWSVLFNIGELLRKG